MGVQDVRQFFINKGLKDPVFEVEDSAATVELAAKALGVEPGMIAKTLSFRLKDRVILIVTCGDARIDNKKYKEYFKTKAKMLDCNEVSEITGHPIGGVCPFGLKNNLDVYLDISLKDFEYVYPAAGSPNAALKITPNELYHITGAEWVDVCQK